MSISSATATPFQAATPAPPEKPPATGTTAGPNAQGAGAAGQAGSASSTAQQKATLNKLLSTYTQDLAKGVDAQTLANLGKQITALAKSLGTHVTLPTAQAQGGAGAAPTNATAPAQTPTGGKGKVNVTA